MGKTHVNTRLFIMSSKKNHHFWLAIFYGVITIGAVSASFSEELAHILTLIDALIRKHAAVALQLSFLAIFSLFLSALRTPAFFWRKSVYLLDFAVFRGEPFMELTKEKQKVVLEKTSCDEESRAFLERLYESSAFGETTLFPPSPMRDFPNNLNSCSMADAMVEAEMVIFKCVEDVLAKTGLSPRDIDVLVVNCSLFCPTPSLSAMVVNRFKMREDIKSFNLGGMGCSAGLIAVDLAKDMLGLAGHSLALVVSTENTILNYYRGAERAMLLANALFRVGGAALVLSTCRRGAKLRLLRVVRTHLGCDDACFRAVAQKEDARGLIGVRIGREVMRVAAGALEANMRRLGPAVLPWTEQTRFLLNAIALRLLERRLPSGVERALGGWLYPMANRLWAGESQGAVCAAARRLCSVRVVDGRYKRYVPDFCKIHAGGKRVIEAMKENLGLPPEKVAASKETLRAHGNTSSSSIWYEMDYHFQHSRVVRGDKIWQIAFGSGFKWFSLALNPSQQQRRVGKSGRRAGCGIE